MPVSRQSRYKDRYDKLLDESLAIVQDRDFTVEELAETAEAAFTRIPGALLVPIDNVEPNPDNPRQIMSEGAMADLAASIAERGLLQPLVVRRHGTQPGQYIVIAGSRRLLAARVAHGDQDEAVRARVAQLPCVIRETTETDAFADALLENLARADLSRAEIMEALVRLQQDFGWSTHLIARRTGRNQSDIAQLLGVARHPELAALVRQDVIKPTVAGEINRLPEPVRAATIAEVHAGTVRTVADVKRRRPVHPRPEQGQSAMPAPQEADRVISLTPLTSVDLPRTVSPPIGSSTTDRVISLTQDAPPGEIAAQLEALGALAVMVDAETAAGQGILTAVRADLGAAYDKLAAYLARRDRPL